MVSPSDTVDKVAMNSHMNIRACAAAMATLSMCGDVGLAGVYGAAVRSKHGGQLRLE